MPKSIDMKTRRLGPFLAIATALGLGGAAVWSGSVTAHPGYLQIYLNDPYSLPKWGYCGTCHINPGGGGYGAPLTVFGEAFKNKNFNVDEELRNEFPDRFSKVPRGESGDSSLVVDNANYAFWAMEGSSGHFSGVTTDSSGSPWFSTMSPAQLVRLDTLGNQFQAHPVLAGCRELAADRHDSIWCLGFEKTTPLSGQAADFVGVFNPESKEMEAVAGVTGSDGLGPMLFDRDRDCLWMSAGPQGDLIQILAETREVRRFESPFQASEGEDSKVDGREAFRGMGVNSAGVWYVVAGGIAQFDPSSQEFRSFDLPDLDEEGGPLMAQGVAVAESLVWLTLPRLGQIVSFDPADQSFVPYQLPLGPDQKAIPSDLRIDGQGRIWISDLKEGAIWNFEPKDRSFLKFPIPADEIGSGSLGGRLHLDAWDGLWILNIDRYKVGLLNTGDY